jgi:DNA-binding transcriptional LysR family regulator
MDRLQAISVFAQVVEQGHLSRAAERLGLSTSAVSRHLADLEAHLGVRLLNRTTRRLSLTEAGQAFYERSVQLLADLEEAEAAVSSGAVTPRGTLKITCSMTFGIRLLAPAIAAFAARHPAVRFEIELSDRQVDIVDEGIDLAVRIGDIGPQTLIGRRIGSMQLVCCAAPAYLAAHGTPRLPAELARHACLTYAYSATGNAWRFLDAQGHEHMVRVQGGVHANNGQMLAVLATSGMGIVLEPDFIVAPELASGALVALLPGHAPAASGIYVVYPSRRHLSAKVRAFADFLVERFRGEGGQMEPLATLRVPRMPAGPTMRR